MAGIYESLSSEVSKGKNLARYVNREVGEGVEMNYRRTWIVLASLALVLVAWAKIA